MLRMHCSLSAPAEFRCMVHGCMAMSFSIFKLIFTSRVAFDLQEEYLGLLRHTQPLCSDVLVLGMPQNARLVSGSRGARTLYGGPV